MSEQALREALEYLVKELNAYAAKNGLGPARLMHALCQAEAVLAASEPIPEPKPCERCGKPDADGVGVWVDKPNVIDEEWLCGGCISKELNILRGVHNPDGTCRGAEPQQAGEMSAPNGVLIIYPYGGSCKFCGKDVWAYSGHYCLAEPATPKQEEGAK